MVTRLANKVYEGCRSGKMQLNGFPNFDQLITSLRQGQTTDRTKSYRVTVQRHDKLVVLRSLAEKWTTHENFKVEADEIIKAHNLNFNNGEGADFWASDTTRTTTPLKSILFIPSMVFVRTHQKNPASANQKEGPKRSKWKSRLRRRSSWRKPQSNSCQSLAT